MCAPQEPHPFVVVISDIFAANEVGPFANPVDFGNFDNVFVDEAAGFDDIFDLPPLDNSFELMDYDPTLFDLLLSYEPPYSPIASNMEPPPYAETSPMDWGDIVVGGLSADGATYTPTFPGYDGFLNFSPPELRLEDVGGLSTPYTPTFPAMDRLAPRALDAMFARYEDNEEQDLLDALDALYEPEDEERRGFKRKIDFGEVQ